MTTDRPYQNAPAIEDGDPVAVELLDGTRIVGPATIRQPRAGIWEITVDGTGADPGLDPHRDPGADPADEWDRPTPPVHNHGAEDGPGLACPERVVSGRRVGGCLADDSRADGLRLAARLLLDNVHRLPIPPRALRTADECEAAADRLDAEQAEDAFVEGLTEALRAVDEGRYAGTYAELARAAVANLRPVAVWLAAEQVWKASLALPTPAEGSAVHIDTGGRLPTPTTSPGDFSPWVVAIPGFFFGPIRSVASAIEQKLNDDWANDGYRVSIALSEAKQTTPRTWPSLEAAPHDVVLTCPGGRRGELVEWLWVDGGWRVGGIGPAWNSGWHDGRKVGPYTEVLP